MKISVVMQSYLGTYPGARKNPEYKFVRAVHSFLAQTHKEKELIIVADGCDITKKLYEQLYSHDSRIRFAYLARNSNKKMYDVETVGRARIKYYFGEARAVGCSMATGDIVTYMDSDDLILPARLSDIAEAWQDKPSDTMWCSNVYRVVHRNATLWEHFGKTFENCVGFITDKPIKLKEYGYDIDDEFYTCISVPENCIFLATYGLSHRRDIRTRWKNTKIINDEETGESSGYSEDTEFAMALVNEGNGFIIKSPTYVVCHYRRGIWDV